MQLHQSPTTLTFRPPARVPSQSPSFGQRLSSGAFSALWQNVSVYNVLFEDAEVDEVLLDLDARSRVLAIAAAGCGVAGMLSARPERIDAVDLNVHHLALTALKCAGARGETSQTRLEALLREGRVRSPLEALAPLASHLPDWAQRYWTEHQAVLSRGLYSTGFTATMLASFRTLAGLDASWLRAAIPMTREERIAHLEHKLLPLLRSPLARAWLSSPAQLLALGINFAQRDRILKAEGTPDMASFVTRYLTRLVDTDLRTNWFVWYAVAGHFDHETEACAPPYLRRERHQRALGTPTDLRLHRRGVTEYLRTRSQRSFTHYTLCDVPDWLDRREQKDLFSEVARTARDGALVLLRSVTDECPIEQLALGARFTLDAQKTRVATEMDRTRQYRAVRFYRVHL